MSNIKVWANNLWKIVGSGNASGISTSQLLEGEETKISVETALERLSDWKDKSAGYIAWLAKNGGGGSGSGGGGGSSTEATCTIKVAGQDGAFLTTDSSIVISEGKNISIKLDAIDIKISKNWNVSIRIGSNLVAIKTASYSSNTIVLSYSDVATYLENYTGNLSIRASYTDDSNAVYGSAEWDGRIVESIVNIQCDDISTTIDGESDNINSKKLDLVYSVGMLGDSSKANYRINVDISKDGTTLKSYTEDITITSTKNNTKSLSLIPNLFTAITDVGIGVYTIEASLTFIANSAISASYTSSLTVASDNILVASTAMKIWDVNHQTLGYYPKAVISGSYTLDFTAYVTGHTTYYYYVTIGSEEVINGAVGKFGVKTQQSISLANKSWVQKDTINKIKLEIYTASDRQGKSTTVYYGVEFEESSEKLLSERQAIKCKVVSDMTARNYNAGDSTFAFSNTSFNSGNTTLALTSSIVPINGNALSVIKNDGVNAPYLRLCNGAIAKNYNWVYGGNTYIFKDLFPTTTSAVKELTISCCFKADYHADDYRTVLFCGTINSDTHELVSGISIDVHDVYIEGVSVCKLTDNTINMVDIVIQQVNGKIPDGNGGTKLITSYIAKVYVDGAMTAVKSLSSFPFPPTTNKVESIYLGGRVTSIGDLCYLCDCNIYSYQVLDTALSDFDIMIKYINNKVTTEHFSNGKPGYNYIQTELKKNFCEVDSDGKVTSLIYDTDTNSYNLSSLTKETSAGITFNESLIDKASAIGIPMMIIDVSGDTSWTFANFSVQQAYGDISLNETDNKRIIYWDPSAANSSVLEFTGDIKLQGHSTLADFVKNINITLPDTTVFIPNKTWFPEKVYTLKADVVDSSHSNNAAIGTFINEILGPNENNGSGLLPFDQTALDNVYKSDYKKNQQKDVTLKHTVTGFPVLLFMKFSTTTTSTVSVTPLGIYSFNLGRDSYRNLGFKKVNSITFADKSDQKVEVFPFLSTNATITETDCDADWIEIANTSNMDVKGITDKLPADFNSSEGDFWQNDDNILNSRFEVRYPTGTTASQRTNFKNKFVSGIMELPIEGCATSNEIGTVTIPQIVSTYNVYKCNPDGTNFSVKGTCTMSSDSNHFTEDAIGINPESFYVYFDIALMFGLIDNFGKNSTYRSWNGGKYFVDFYDMDSANGGSNQGELTIGPDVWLKYLYNAQDGSENYGYVAETFDVDKALQSTTETKVSANQNKLWLSLDTPTARSVFSGLNGNSRYAEYWKYLMSQFTEKAKAAGYDYNPNKPSNPIVDWFMDKYFIAQTKNCGPLLFNLDYKLKYLMQFTSNTYENMTALPKLHGRKIAYTRDWLTKHLQFLDSLFNWRGSTAFSHRNNVNTTASNSVLSTVKDFPIKMNTALIFRSTIGDSSKAFYFAPKNKEVITNAGNNRSNSVLTWVVNNSPNIINLGNSSTKLADMSIQTIKANGSQSKLDYEGLPSITVLDLSGNKTFSNNFDLTAFTKGAISEIRELNFSNTATSDGSKFNLDLTYNNGEDTYFQKLTKINISNSTCINQITIPRIPLQELLLTNSSITKFVLRKQSYLDDVDLTGCSNITDIELSECTKYKKLSLSNLTQLSTVNINLCESFEELELINCKSLTSVSIENCQSIKKITIKNCINLVGTTDKLHISGCPSLTSLDLSGCSKLSTFYIDSANQSNITVLNLASTSVKHITYSSGSASSQMLDLSSWTSLNSFTISGNSSVENIQFANNATKSIPLNNTFKGCTGLKRVYGHVAVGINGIFNGCRNFSIHGTDLEEVKYGGQSVLTSEKRVKMPWEFVDAGTPSKFNNVVFMVGNKVTNMYFNTTSLAESFMGTACTTFDIYYVLSNCLGVTDFTRTFASLMVSPFNWTDTVDNSPNRYMFKWCSQATNMYEMFYGNTGSIRLFSPHVTEGAITDDGLFSPLVDTLVNAGRMFFNFTIYSNKYLFRHSSKNYMISNLNYFNSYILYNSSDTCGRNNVTISYSNYTEFGDFTDFFKQLPYLKALHYVMSGTSYINYDTLKGLVATSLTKSFNSSYGSGTITPSQLFANNGSNVVSIKTSFIVGNTFSGIKANMPLTDNTFSSFTSLTALGYGSDSAVESPLNSSFTGNGINKYIDQNTFPYNIIPSGAKSKITMFTGLFMNCAKGSMTDTPVFPGTLFTGCSALKDTSATFYGVQFAYSLEGDKMKDCSGLQKVAYMFASAKDTKNYLTGQIPAKLFYHGHTAVSKTVKGILASDSNSVTQDETDSNHWTIVKGSNTYYLNIVEGAAQWTNADGETITEAEVLDSKTISYNSMKATITDMQGCFMGANTSAFSGTPTEENNENYMPFTAVFSGSVFIPVTVNNYEKTAVWSWDGDYDSHSYPSRAENFDAPSTIENDLYYDSVKSESQGCTKNFCCAPDLLRYCSPTCNVTYLFAYAGHNLPSIDYGNKFSADSYGIHGRIPPYLLYPLKNSNSVNINYMFCNCKQLSYYMDDNVAYMIPKDFFKDCKNIESMNYTFCGMNFPKQINLNVFSSIPSSKLKEVIGTFYTPYFYGGDSADRTNVSDVFNTHAGITKAFRCFAATQNGNNQTPKIITQYVKFSNIFPSSFATSKINNSNFSEVFAWYSEDSVEHENPITLPNNSTTNNYTYYSNKAFILA